MTKTKTCSKCGINKPASEYSRWKLSKDGLYSRCKECHKHENNTEHQVIKRFLNAHKNRLTCTKTYSEDKFIQWLYDNNFQEMYDAWKEAKYDKSIAPSVDRIDSRKGYDLSNMQLITWDFNHLKKTIDVWNERGYTGITSGKTRHRASHSFFGEMEVATFNTFTEAYQWKLKRIKNIIKYLNENNIKTVLVEGYTNEK